MLISTSEPNGLCFIETAELDGETNLKVRQALEETCDIKDNIDSLSRFDGKILISSEKIVLIKSTIFSVQLKSNSKRRTTISDVSKAIYRGKAKLIH